jgi:adenylate cyclase
MTDADALQSASGALASGNLALAYDVATQALKLDETQQRLRYFQTLALARMGEIDRARDLYERHMAGGSDLDVMALGARLLKDAAWSAPAENQRPLLLEASAAYEAIFQLTNNAFPAVNAASLAFLANQADHAANLARQALRALGEGAPLDYFAAATAAEAQLLLGDDVAAARSMDLALLLPGCDYGARSSTTRQLARLVQASGRGRELLARLRPPPVMTFCGHMFAADAGAGAALSAEITAALDELGSTIAYGALACGADIIIAEAILARRGELNVVLPYMVEDFVHTSVAPGGGEWVDRFDLCMQRAADVVIASETGALGDDRQFRYGSTLMMGFARLRARHLEADAVQLAVWDERPTDGMAGTAGDVRQWRANGGRSRIISFDRTNCPAPRPVVQPAVLTASRKVRGLVFADFVRFTKIPEADLPDVWERLLGCMAEVASRFDAEICTRNTWGDGLHFVTRTAAGAADLALELQSGLAAARIATAGFIPALRVSAHLGAVYEAVDPVTQRTTFFGREVNRTARIEPIASVGQVYVTRAFGAALAMEAPARFDLSYVGVVELAKNFGVEQMYRLTRARNDVSAAASRTGAVRV